MKFGKINFNTALTFRPQTGEVRVVYSNFVSVYNTTYTLRFHSEDNLAWFIIKVDKVNLTQLEEIECIHLCRNLFKRNIYFSSGRTPVLTCFFLQDNFGNSYELSASILKEKTKMSWNNIKTTKINFNEDYWKLFQLLKV